MMKTKQDNNTIDPTRVAYVENETELSWPIKPDVDCDENQMGQQHD